jgi:hypothetical protein
MQMLLHAYLKKINASPATSRFELTKTLQPVVSRCLRGCPGRNSIKNLISKWTVSLDAILISRNFSVHTRKAKFNWKETIQKRCGNIVAPKKCDKFKHHSNINSPRKMWRKCHSFAWRSLATSSCHGGFWVISYMTVPCTTNVEYCKIINMILCKWVCYRMIFMLTSAGKHSSACLLRTENPPWVLVSEAVKVLQKEWALHFSGSCGSGSALVGSVC